MDRNEVYAVRGPQVEAQNGAFVVSGLRIDRRGARVVKGLQKNLSVAYGLKELLIEDPNGVTEANVPRSSIRVDQIEVREADDGRICARGKARKSGKYLGVSKTICVKHYSTTATFPKLIILIGLRGAKLPRFLPLKARGLSTKGPQTTRRRTMMMYR